jgi:excisionase family DNA binding protein
VGLLEEILDRLKRIEADLRALRDVQASAPAPSGAVTIKKAGQQLALSVSRVRELLATGELTACGEGRSRRVTSDSIQRYLSGQTGRQHSQ